MNNKNRLYTYVIFTFICIVSINSQPISLKQNINWPEFMSRQDMVWEKLPEYWYESAYLGNGRLGLMIYKEPGKNYLRLETGNCDVHDHRVQRDVFGIPRLLTGYTLPYILKEKLSAAKCALTFGMPKHQQILSPPKVLSIYKPLFMLMIW